MKKFNFLFLIVIAAMTASCSVGVSLSKKDALDYIVEELDANSAVTATIPVGIKSQSKIEDSDMLKYRIYESAGLITIQDTTYNYRSTSWGNYGKTLTANGIYFQFTEKGDSAVVKREEKNATVFMYAYEFNTINDISLIMKKEVEDFNAEYHAYTVCFSGNITEASVFANALGIAVKDKYPLSESEKDVVMGKVFDVVYRDGKMLDLDDRNTRIIQKSNMAEYNDQVWCEMFGKYI